MSSISDENGSPAIDLSKLNPPEQAPDNGRQFLAWGIDLHGLGIDSPASNSRWMVVQWASDHPGGKPYWRWSYPGGSSSVQILGWLDLPWNDIFGDAAMLHITRNSAGLWERDQS